MTAPGAVAADVERILRRCPRDDGGERFTVVCPVYNRRRTLPRALDSLVAQSHLDWLCLILDDGSTDGSGRVAERYANMDSRFLYVRFGENRGGVTMNEIGMRVACEVGAYWSRLGSDDWFEPHKLEVDHVTLSGGDVPACFGPYRCTGDHLLDDLLSSRGIGILRTPSRVATTWADAALRNESVRRLRRRLGGTRDALQSPPADARETLLAGMFAMSWANVAIRTEVLRRVRAKYGTFCDPRSRNMEDFHCNARIASVSSIAWRGLKRDRRTVVIGATTWSEAGGERAFLHDGTWRGARDGASSNRHQVALDSDVTLAAIAADYTTHPPDPCPPPRPRTVQLQRRHKHR